MHAKLDWAVLRRALEDRSHDVCRERCSPGHDRVQCYEQLSHGISQALPHGQPSGCASTPRCHQRLPTMRSDVSHAVKMSVFCANPTRHNPTHT
jgi:hypothetical protein